MSEITSNTRFEDEEDGTVVKDISRKDDVGRENLAQHIAGGIVNEDEKIGGYDKKRSEWVTGYFSLTSALDNRDEIEVDCPSGEVEFVSIEYSLDGVPIIVYPSKKSIWAVSRMLKSEGYDNIYARVPDEWNDHTLVGEQWSGWGNGVEFYKVDNNKL